MITLNIPLPLALLAGIILASVLAVKWLMSPYAGDPTPLESLQKQMGLDKLNEGQLFVIISVWLILFSLLLGGLIWVIVETIMAGLPTTDEDLRDWRFALTKLVALTGVLGAVVALPFTLVRIGLSRQQVTTAKDALLNDKINVAVTDLYAQRQITVKRKGTYHDIWEDNITRRNGAIDRLEGLVAEDKSLSPRVSRMLSVYVRELSKKGAEAKEVPEGLDGEALEDWARGLTVQRSDMEKAVQTLGRLPMVKEDQGQRTRPVLTGAKLQAMDLSELNFENANLRGAQLQGANVRLAQLQGADLSDAQLQGANLSHAQLQGAHLTRARLQGANLSHAQLQGADLSGAQLQGAFLVGAKLQGANVRLAQLQGADLLHAQLQGAHLTRARLQGAHLIRARLQGADLIRAQFSQDTDLRAATLRGAALRSVDFTEIPQIADHLEDLFGDATVKLPPDLTAPARFSESYKNDIAFRTAWRDFQRSIGQVPENPQ